MLATAQDQADGEELFNELAAEFRDCRDELGDFIDEIFFSPFRGLIVGVCEFLDDLAEPGEAWNWKGRTPHDMYQQALLNKYTSVGFEKAEALRIMDNWQYREMVDAFLHAGGSELTRTDKAEFVNTMRNTIFKQK